MHPPLRQHQVDPDRQRKLQRLAHEAAAAPQEQVLGGLLGDGRGAAHVAQFVGLLDGVAFNSPQSMPRWVQNLASSETITDFARIGAMRSIGTKVRWTGAPRIQRHSIDVETGSITR